MRQSTRTLGALPPEPTPLIGREGDLRNFTDTAAFLAALGSPAVSLAG